MSWRENSELRRLPPTCRSQGYPDCPLAAPGATQPTSRRERAARCVVPQSPGTPECHFLAHSGPMCPAGRQCLGRPPSCVNSTGNSIRLTRGTSLNAAAQTELTHKRRSNERKQPKPLEELRFAPQNLIPGADRTQPVNALERSQTEL